MSLIKCSLIALICLIGSCQNTKEMTAAEYARENLQITPVTSEDGFYTATVNVVESPKDGFDYWWSLTVVNMNNQIVFQDETTFPGRFNIYWLWDGNDRLWVLNSDDGEFYYWDNARNVLLSDNSFIKYSDANPETRPDIPGVLLIHNW